MKAMWPPSITNFKLRVVKFVSTGGQFSVVISMEENVSVGLKQRYALN